MLYMAYKVYIKWYIKYILWFYKTLLKTKLCGLKKSRLEKNVREGNLGRENFITGKISSKSRDAKIENRSFNRFEKMIRWEKKARHF